MLITCAGLVVVGASPAAAAPTIKLSSSGPFTGGDKVTVTLAGFSPNAPIAVGLIPASRFPAEGPGDACASKLGCGALLVADASGGLTKELTIVEGPIQNGTPPAESCGPENDCVIGAANINKPAETVKADITYASATTKSSTTTTKKSATTSSGASASKTTTTTKSTTTSAGTESATLPKTGPAETLVVGLLGVAVLQLGLIVAVRALRNRPRYVAR
jgi:hypothetical protein